ncbi:Cross-pathway control protein 1 [Escovopsis weberi]|uniref:Cross-pathway control protein 1 n=1 Tax=Escovopsis weberi TaxID=150374 RepID=A0A0M8N0M0_ESCWE|nr:Cross-pathway control protein 1 [Escovopsis weberi]
MMNAADVDLDDLAIFDGSASTALSSPAISSGFDFSSSSSVASHIGTVSPQDLFKTDSFMSTPNSAALTALTSPSLYNGSPDFDGCNISPHFDASDFGGSNEAWFSLFPAEAGSLEQMNSGLSPSLETDDISSEHPAANGSSKKKSAASPTTSTRHSSVSGVNARRRDKPLPPIVVEDMNDTVAMKRARNTLAARKSRERKAQRFEELEERIAKLEAERDHWKRIALSQSGMLAE